MDDDGQDLTAQEVKEAQQMFQDERLRLSDPRRYHARLHSSSANYSSQTTGGPSNLRQYPSPSQPRVQQAVPSKSNLSKTPSHIALKVTQAQLKPAILALFSLENLSPKSSQISPPLRKDGRKQIYRALTLRNPPQPSAWELSGKLRNLILRHASHEKHFERICQGIEKLLEKHDVDPNVVVGAMRELSSIPRDGKGLEAANPIELDGDSDSMKTARSVALEQSQMQPQKSSASNVPIREVEDNENEDVAMANHDAQPETSDLIENKENESVKEKQSVTVANNDAAAKTNDFLKSSGLTSKRQSPQETHAVPRTASAQSNQRTPEGKRPRTEDTDDVSFNKKQKQSNKLVLVGQQLARMVPGEPHT